MTLPNMADKLAGLVGKRVFVRVSAAPGNPPEDYVLEGILYGWYYTEGNLLKYSHPYELILVDGYYRNVDWPDDSDTRYFEGDKKENILLNRDEVDRLCEV